MNDIFFEARELLRHGQFQNGFNLMEWRFGKEPNRFPIPECTNVYLKTEQGFGDTFQFIRFAEKLANGTRKVILQSPRPLSWLVNAVDGIDSWVDHDHSNSDGDLMIHLLSLPFWLGIDPISAPTAFPYIRSNQNRSLASFPESNQLKIGLSWQGNPKNAQEPGRSFPLLELLPLAQLPFDFELISLQKCYGVEQIKNWDSPRRIFDLGSEIDNSPMAFHDTLLALTKLDLFITSDSALAHLSGAAGVPTWVLLPYHADWRWGKGGESSVWYPTMRLFRQNEPGNWTNAINEVVKDLIGFYTEK